MLKKIGTILFIIILSFGTGAGVCYCYLNLDMNQNPEEEELQYTYCSFSVIDTEFENSLSITGSIEVSEEQHYIDCYPLYYSDALTGQTYVEKGDIVEHGDIIGYGLEEESLTSIVCKSYGKVVDIENVSSEQCVYVKVLNYDALYFSVTMSHSQAESFDYDSEVYYYDENGDKVPCRIDFIGYEIMEDKTIQLHVVPEETKPFTPGISKTLYFVIKKSDRCLALAKDAVMEQGGTYTVLMEKDGAYEEKEIKVGNVFGVVEDENTFYYYPILAGLKDGDIVYTRQLAIEENAGLEKVLE